MKTQLKAKSGNRKPESANQTLRHAGSPASRFTFHVSRITHHLPRHPSPVTRHSSLAFTLIELLVVIAIISLLASLIFPVTAAVRKARILTRARTELAKVETAIVAYQLRLGYYPPADPTPDPAINPLYYELRGTTYNSTNRTYTTLDGSAQMKESDLGAVFGLNGPTPRIGGFQNCSRGAGGDEGQTATPFLAGFRAGQFLRITNNAVPVTLLGTTVEGPRMFDGAPSGRINPWRYNSSSPTNNPNSFDLWTKVNIGNKIYLISNWGAKPQLTTDPY